TYFVRDVRYSRATLVFWVAFAIVMVSLARVGSRVFMRGLRARGYNLRHVIVVGTGRLSAHVIETIHRESALGLRVAGRVSEDDETLVPVRTGDVPLLGRVADLPRLLQRMNVDQVIVALPIDKL